MNLIVAVDKKWGIGKNNGLLVSISDDLKRFKALTLDKVVVMGYNTLISLPGQKPLKNRTNIVLTSKKIEIEGAIVVNDLSALKNVLRGYSLEDVFIIGGESVYRQFVDFCDYAYITYIDKEYDADRFFPVLNDSWKLIDEESASQDELEFYFRKYKNTNVKVF